MDDDDLVARVAAGDDTALRELFGRHAPWLAVHLSQMGGNSSRPGGSRPASPASRTTPKILGPRPKVGQHLGDRPLAGVGRLCQLVRAEGLDAGAQPVMGVTQRADPRARASFHMCYLRC